MAGNYDNTNRGVLFKNTRKKPGEKFPDYQGTINFGGTEMELAAWIKEFKPGHKNAGQKFFSLSVKPKQTQQAAPISDPLDNDAPL